MTSGEPFASAGLFSPGAVGSAAEAETGDRAFLQALLDAEAALTRAQARVGAAPASAAATVTEAADADRYDARDLALRARAGGNPVIPLIADLTARVAQVSAAEAEFVHRGATSQDILDTALMLVAVRTLDHVLADLDATAASLGALAAQHRTSPMAGRTLTQHAVPTTFGLKAAGWRSLVLDAHDRLSAVRESLPAQLGGAAGTLAAFGEYGPAAPLDLVSAYAAELGLAVPDLPWHTLRTPVADLAGALAFTAGALGKIAADVLVLSRTEIGELAEGAGGGSSAMPHKSNPVRATLIAATARQVPALTGVLYASLAAEDERPAGAWHAEWQPLRDALRLTGGAARDAAELAGGLTVHTARMRAHLDRTNGLIASERLSAALAPLLGRAEAKQALSRATAHAVEHGTDLAEALAEQPAVVAALAGAAPRDAAGAPPDGTGPAAATQASDAHRTALARLRDLADPTQYLGSAPELVDRALARHPLARHPRTPLQDPR
ncbi:3-carboxy-cis,cis-muconate cycloisomerase [Streptomyces spiroverticillatus]|uniref:3-carboxy-cis,cis-muconate cycloisomerase n=1 Tax=Streptomyces finlayi TaxID=67296 RepID=A0A919CAN3_9ACTN|nr:3-carboxy-cis,cis-muconate cycloisomerase [Streptomyces finlayi]GHA15430.1 3-carboxy-cis,cis-muconate cycloisomerase [Streptomyces spiroverticillatus]GHC96739.1 3-carboxy-cis,cis-muconate cycloisomerase [Streptomyces finlayi]